MKYIIFGAGSTLAQTTIKKLLNRGDEVCGVLHHNISSGLCEIPYICNVDMSNPSITKKKKKKTEHLFGIPDHFISCVGKSKYHNFTNDSLQQWYKVFEANYYSCVNTTYIATQLLQKHDNGGSIVVIGSGYGIRHIPYLSSYCASKGALLSFVRTLSTELGGRIRINLVTPGLFPSNMTKEFIENNKYIEQLLAHIPDKRIGNADEISDTILFLTSNSAKHINGAEIIVDGGMLNLIEGGIIR